MDFRRSTLVLIISFLLLDIFLFGLFWQMKKEVKTPLNTSINVMEQMRNDGITVTGVNMTVESLPIIQISPISIEAPVNALPSQVVSYDKGVISSQLIFPIQLTLDANATATMENFAELFAASEAQAEEFKKGKVAFKVDKLGSLHLPLGKVDFTKEAVTENFKVAMDQIIKLKPAASKGQYLRSVAISLTMGPGIKVDPILVSAFVGK